MNKKIKSLTGGNIQAIRLFLGYNKTDFAKLIGVDPSTLYQYEVGKFHPNGEVIETLFSKTNIVPNQFYKKDLSVINNLPEFTNGQ